MRSAMAVIHSREPEVLERHAPQQGGQLGRCLISACRAARDPFEDIPQLILVHAAGAAVCD